MSRMSATQINQEVPDQAHTKFIPANLEEDCPMVTTHYRRSAFCQTVAAIKAILVELHIPKTYLGKLLSLLAWIEVQKKVRQNQNSFIQGG